MNIDERVWETLFTADEIRERVKEMGKQISEDYKEKKLLIISLMRGSFVFAADLVREIDIPLIVDFMTTSSYGHDTKSSGRVKVLSDINFDIEGYDIIVVDDIMDSGITMKFVINYLGSRNPKSIKSCVLLNKADRREVDLVPDYLGYEIPDLFVVGYGLNYGNYYRNIPYIFAVTDELRK